jgi:hypothetical protein
MVPRAFWDALLNPEITMSAGSKSFRVKPASKTCLSGTRLIENPVSIRMILNTIPFTKILKVKINLSNLCKYVGPRPHHVIWWILIIIDIIEAKTNQEGRENQLKEVKRVKCRLYRSLF